MEQQIQDPYEHAAAISFFRRLRYRFLGLKNNLVGHLKEVVSLQQMVKILDSVFHQLLIETIGVLKSF